MEMNRTFVEVGLRIGVLMVGEAESWRYSSVYRRDLRPYPCEHSFKVFISTATVSVGEKIDSVS